jgi:hypothetical protein
LVALRNLGFLLTFVLFAPIAATFDEGQAQTPKQKVVQADVQPKPAQIDRNGVLILVRSALLALDQANKTGNYTVLRDLGAPGFQANTAARLSEIFAKQRNDNIDLSGVAVIDPQLSLLPQIEANGMMRMTGFFPSVPSQVNFELIYAPVNGQWRLFGLGVTIGQMAPTAPETASPTPGPAPSPIAATGPARPTAQKQAPASATKQPPKQP